MNKNQIANPVSLKDVKIHDSFFSDIMATAVEKLIPYQWKALNDEIPDAAPSYCIRNFKAAAGMLDAPHGGAVFQDTDLAKWIEAAAYSLVWKPDAQLESSIDAAIELVAAAQQEDGYLDTSFIIERADERWTNLKDWHELYTAGHMLEAAVAYYQATGKDRFLTVMRRNIDYIMTVIGPEEGKLHAYPGHEVLEMALCRLYEVCGEEKYLLFARYLIDERGREPNFFVSEAKRFGREESLKRGGFDLKYFQADRPVREQPHAEGHAVRAGYLYSGMADVARLTGDDTLTAACRRIWRDVVSRQMYITGAVGQSRIAEAFTYDYDLPNGLIYGETCAAIALAFFARRMSRLEPDGEYGDILEKTLYNGTISGMSLDGQSFFYVNPLEVLPERCEKNQQYAHVKPVRQKWFGCACCPPNLARLVCSLPEYIYNTCDSTIYVNLYTTNDACIPLKEETVGLKMETRYPWDGEVTLVTDASGDYTLALRLPGWCRDWTLTVNGEAADAEIIRGYAYIRRSWKAGDCVRFAMQMPVRVVHANPRVADDIGKVAVMRGPVVYCLEQVDNGAGLQRVYLPRGAQFTCAFEPELLGGVVTLSAQGLELQLDGWDADCLYRDDAQPEYAPRALKFIPYYAWVNRTPGEMTVWVHEIL